MSRVVTWEAGKRVLGPAVVAIGVFDGVHVGHATLVRDAVASAREMGAAACVLTFDRDPDQVVSPDRAQPQLLPLDDKVRYLAQLGPDVVLVVPFDVHVAALTPERFCDEVLLDAVLPVHCVVGADFRFGAGARGDVATLQEIGATRGFSVRAHELVEVGGAPVSSSRIRAAIASGDVAGAAVLLGRFHRLRGRVVHGRGIGHELGAPTANLHVERWSAVPARGVYAARALVGGRTYASGVAVGPSPTFGTDVLSSVEAHLIGYEGELYAETVTLEFVDRIRDQRAFDSAEELAEQIQQDLARARDLVSTADIG